MSPRTAAWLAWLLCALSLALTALSLLLLALILSHPHTHTFDDWLDSTLNAVFYSTVGAIVASRRPENPVGWLLCLWALSESISHFSGQYAIYALLTQPATFPAGQAMAWVRAPILKGSGKRPVVKAKECQKPFDALAAYLPKKVGGV